MAQDMKENSEIHWSMESELKDFAMEKLMSEIIKRIDQMEKDNITGQMVIIIRGSFLMGLDMAKATSKKIKRKFNIEDSIKTIRNAVTVKLIIKMVSLTQEISKITIGMALVSFSRVVKWNIEDIGSTINKLTKCKCNNLSKNHSQSK